MLLLLAGRLALGGIFLFAAYAKLHFGGAWHLRDYQFFFAMAINSYNMLPLPVVQVDGSGFCRGLSLSWARC